MLVGNREKIFKNIADRNKPYVNGFEYFIFFFLIDYCLRRINMYIKFGLAMSPQKTL